MFQSLSSSGSEKFWRWVSGVEMDTKSRIWKPLDPAKKEIRLFVLAPDEDQLAVPKGTLITRSLDQQLFYDAISHAWGAPSFPEVVSIDGIEWIVTIGVFHALQRLRHPTDQKVFWIDALCVDQTDLKERAEQVKLMQFIFNRAVEVQVWLGSNDPSVSGLIDAMQHPRRRERLFSNQKATLETQADFEALMNFVRVDYWSRTWIIQELTLARSVRFHYGRKTFVVEEIKDLYKQFEYGPRLGDRTQRMYIRRILGPITKTSSVLRVATMGTLEEKAVQLTQVLQAARLSQCHDHRDRIYGFLGIVSAMFGGEFIHPNYECGVAETYTEFASRLITVTGSLAVLNQAESICNSTLGLPTFVPDWSSRFQQHDAVSRLNINRKYYASGPTSTDRAKEAASQSLPTQLKCCGFIIGSVQVIGECSQSVFGSPRSRVLRTVIESWRQLYHGKEENFVKLIAGDRLKKAISLEACLDSLQVVPDSRAAPNEERDAIGNAASSRRFFVLSSGQAGLGPRDTRIGDVVAILAGGMVPLMLRKSSNSTEDLNLFTFVGECYVEGVMYGELLKRPNTPEDEDIWLE